MPRGYAEDEECREPEAKNDDCTRTLLARR
jgi:hypothetical protein